MRIASSNEQFLQPGIQEYFAGKTVFLTGCTGLVGQLILEKLLRTCLDIKMIYVLIRERKGKSVQKRFEELFDNEIYHQVKGINPSFHKKASPIKGDNSVENLGISSEDAEKLIKEVNCVIHCSASVNFNEGLRTMVYTNIRSTIDLIRLARQIKDLQSFIYVSTAYSNCPNEEISEVIYKPPLSAEKLLTLVNTSDDTFLEQVTPSVIESWQNTYLYSKCIAESAVVEKGKGLPVAIVRPSIIISTYNEPLEGWCNNSYGIIGLSMSVRLGLVRTINCESDYIVDIVPADYVANNIIAVAWSLGSQKYIKYTDKKHEIKVYNCVSSCQNPITYKSYMNTTFEMEQKMPLTSAHWYPFVFLVSSPMLNQILHYFLHLIPAYVGDFIFLWMGQKPKFVKTCRKVSKFLDVMVYFSTHQWKFSNDATLELWNKLNEEDKQTYPFNMSLFKWKDALYSSARGDRIYLLKDPLETVPQAERKHLVLKILHYGLIAFLLFGVFVIVSLAWRL